MTTAPDPGGSIEAKYATGFTRQAGKHTAHTGPLTRGGRLKIFGEVSAAERDKWRQRAAELDEIVKKELHGRNATIFEGRVTDSLLGRGPKRSAEELATQLGINAARVY